MIAGARPASFDSAERRFTVTPLMELAVLALAIAVAVASYFILTGEDSPQRLLAPPLVALLLVANLVPGIALLMLLGRRIAKRRAARSPVGGEGRLHVRLVALFSIVAAVPMLLVAIAASLLFQYGIQFSSSDRARGMVENATVLVRENYKREVDKVLGETRAMTGDVASYLADMPILSPRFTQGMVFQTYKRELSEAMIVRRDDPNPLIVLNPNGRPLDNIITTAMMDRVDREQAAIPVPTRGRIGALIKLDYGPNTYLYVARSVDEQLAAQIRRGDAILADYKALVARSRVLQLRFNIALVIVSLLIVGVAVWFALQLADRLVRPVVELVDAVQRVEGGDLAARVPERRERDEVGTLANAFNSMTERLEEQNNALVSANAQLDSRRALIEAVMSGVSAGVISIAGDRTIRLINSSAEILLNTGEASPIGRPLALVAPELDALLDGATREAIVQVDAGGDAKTLAVRITRDGTGPILTFDDITQQLLDQRRAAWSDVARRIAHEIKNPLTPIQLAAERLQRRYGAKVAEDDTTFGRLTDTIVRQVGDLRRMVDEFSSFARMPKPLFREESLVDIARQTLFLHEVAHTGIRFALVHDDPGPSLVCDRRQVGQALTNIVKNAVEAIEAAERGEGAITMTLGETPDRVTIEVADTGVGLPVERDRIVEPYMTTRARGTGLGLAIVKKIIEEHCGTIAFLDRPEGGTLVTISFDTAALRALEVAADDDDHFDGGQLAALTRNRT